MTMSTTVNSIESVLLKDGLSLTQHAWLESATVGHRVKSPNDFHLLLNMYYVIPSCQEKHYPQQILSHRPFPRKISTSVESEEHRHARQIHRGERCVREKWRENTCLWEWEMDRAVGYLIRSSRVVFLQRVEWGCECVWCWLSPVPAG